ncbi:hypothetical protein HER10_EVM0003896 [Colletotrichum scovillei]|uniref:uncharacterized protein n=1 Tax=Colletotrichum scovillei TaxID=1209932 RepID=UPI0015C3CCBF|nr:uncharacterized protein HER10_EVM0003896 [Colletotrichum scovillei]KAF4785220.1 hypothetical protein HER10_EVM0003896 [Colletotrichum scovillei]
MLTAVTAGGRRRPFGKKRVVTCKTRRWTEKRSEEWKKGIRKVGVDGVNDATRYAIRLIRWCNARSPDPRGKGGGVWEVRRRRRRRRRRRHRIVYYTIYYLTARS